MSTEQRSMPHAAMRSAAEFLLKRFGNAPCDSRGVSDCVRCNAVALSKWMLEMLTAEAKP